MRTSLVLVILLLAACPSSSEPTDAGSDDSAAADVGSGDVGSGDVGSGDVGSGDVGSGDVGSDAGSDAGGEQCMGPTDCVLVPQSCCGACGQPSRGDIDSIPMDQVSQHRAMACGEDTACPACAQPPDPTLLADCSMGSCVVLDLAPPTGPAPSLTQCETNLDCILRAMDCCGCGILTADNVVALNREDGSRYGQYVCDPAADCPDCIPMIPDSVRASCQGEGPARRCEVISAGAE